MGERMNSLPLMGIGNLTASRMLLKILDLITPHGDRELVVVHQNGGCSWDSLPLMGIGNQRPRPQPPRATPSAHYPSWGSGTRESGDPTVNNRGTVSLPLMGIGNAIAQVNTRAVHELITPHGDRELWCVCVCVHTAMETHYPSWGSGTTRPART